MKAEITHTRCFQDNAWGWGDGYISEVLAMQVAGPEFNTQHGHIHTHTYSPNAGEVETGSSPALNGQPG